MKYMLAAIVVLSLWPLKLEATVKTEQVKYQVGDVACQGFLAYDDSLTGKRPGIVVLPEWWGLNDYAKVRAQMLAQLGYVALAADLFGNGQTTEDPNQAGKLAGALKSNRPLLRQQANAALDQLKSNSRVDSSKLGAIGYCFGGTTAIELGRSGADIKAIVTFHAGLDSPNAADGKNIKAKIQVCHGRDDTFSSQKDLDAFEQEMRQNKVDWQMNVYGNAVHSFTNPGADKHGIPGISYNAEADRRSWLAMQLLFTEAFGAAR
jgi:dienelactone hydrolase